MYMNHYYYLKTEFETMMTFGLAFSMKCRKVSMMKLPYILYAI